VHTGSHTPTRLAVTFDDDRAVAGAGLALVATLSRQLGTFALANELIDLGDRPGHAVPGRKVLTLVHAMVAGADCIDDCDVLRAGATGRVLGHGVMAPSTLGTFLRAFTFGHVRQLDALSEALLAQAWAFEAGPGKDAMTIDIDSTIQQVYGKQKQGSAYGYTKVLGQHPLVATRSDTGEVLHIRHRKGSANAGRGGPRFVRELIGRVRRCGATGPLTLRADSGFHSKHVVAACRDHDVRYSITVNQNKAVVRAIEAISEETWTPIDYTLGGEAQVSECSYGDGHRLVVRRTRLTGKQAELFPTWRYHAFITDREGTAVFLDADHRNHAVVELAIRDRRKGPAWRTALRGTSTPTRRGRCSPPSPTTCSDGCRLSGSTTKDRSSRRRSGGSSSPSPVASRTGRDVRTFTCQQRGRGPPNGQRASTACGHCRCEPEARVPGWSATAQPLPERSHRHTP
jgi:hypothetical protein